MAETFYETWIYWSIYDWKHHIKRFGLGGAFKPGEEEEDSIVFVEQPQASPGSAKIYL